MKIIENIFKPYDGNEDCRIVLIQSGVYTHAFFHFLLFAIVSAFKLIGFGGWASNHHCICGIMFLFFPFIFKILIKSMDLEIFSLRMKWFLFILLLLLIGVVIASLDNYSVYNNIYMSLFLYFVAFEILSKTLKKSLNKYLIWLVGGIMLTAVICTFCDYKQLTASIVLSFILLFIFLSRVTYTAIMLSQIAYSEANNTDNDKIQKEMLEKPYLCGILCAMSTFDNLFSAIGSLSGEMAGEYSDKNK